MSRIVAFLPLFVLSACLPSLFGDPDCNASDLECNPAVLLAYAPIQYRLTAGGGHTCALQSSGIVRCWGQALNAANGALADIGAAAGTMPPPPLPLGGAVRQIAAGNFHTCVIMVDGTVRCWGLNDQGQLGVGAIATIGDNAGEMPPAITPLGGIAIQLSLGASHSCALMLGGAVKCWGDAAQGQLGQGSTTDIGVAPGQMPPPDVPLGEAAVAIGGGGGHTCALLASGSVKCWGQNSAGQLGQGNITNLGDNPGEMPPPSINLGGAVAQLAVSQGSNCTILQTGAVKCWGDGVNGALGYGNINSIGDNPGEMPPADVNLGGAASFLGSSGVSAFMCAAMRSGNLTCWGFNSNGQLGRGDAVNHGGAPGDVPPAATPVSGAVYQIATGGFFTCVMLIDSSVQCWGAAGVGQLGYENITQLGDNPGELPTAFVRYR